MSGARLKVKRGNPARRARVERAKEMRDGGSSWEEIAKELGVTVSTAYRYVHPRDHSLRRAGRPEFHGPTKACAECGETKGGCVKFQGGWWCPECLGRDNDPLTLEKFADRRHGERNYWC